MSTEFSLFRPYLPLGLRKWKLDKKEIRTTNIEGLHGGKWNIHIGLNGINKIYISVHIIVRMLTQYDAKAMLPIFFFIIIPQMFQRLSMSNYEVPKI